MSRNREEKFMAIEYLGLSEINGPLVVLEGVKNASYEEIVEFHMDDGTRKIGRIIEIYEDKAVIQVFEGTDGMSLGNTHTRLTGRPMEIGLSPEILGRTFNGIGQPIDGLGDITPDVKLNINGLPLNPVAREYPRNYINTGISAIDGLTTLIRGQKLPIFSGNGLPHDKLAAQIVQQASLGEDSDEDFAIVFAAMGVKYDVAEFFRRTFEESGAADHVVMFLNLANDPVVERLLTPKIALTAAEYLAFEKGMHILVILTDITSFCEAMREVSSSKGEIPSRKGYPGYLYSELATLYERAGIVKGKPGSVTQIPILTMPNDDITHPIPDLTGYITEGQIVLDRQLHGQAIYPPINVLPSLSRLMKDGIGEGYTRADHQDVANQLFSCYAKVGDARALASVIGEDELSPLDKRYLVFGKAFESEFVGQSETENRSITETLDKGWELLGLLPKEELDRIDTKILDKYYHETVRKKKRGDYMDPNTFPTKGNLILAKNSLKLSRQGYELMDKKRNILIREMMELIDQAKDIQTQIDVTFRTAYTALQKANMEIGIAFVQQIACTVPVENSIRIKTRSVMGTEIPLVEYDKTTNTPTYAYYSTKMSLDEAKAAFEKVKELSIRLSMVENAAIRLAANIKKTQKRANALKNITIPKYEALTKDIQNALEEKEREEFTRLKVIKRMKQK